MTLSYVNVLRPKRFIYLRGWKNAEPTYRMVTLSVGQATGEMLVHIFCNQLLQCSTHVPESSKINTTLIEVCHEGIFNDFLTNLPVGTDLL